MGVGREGGGTDTRGHGSSVALQAATRTGTKDIQGAWKLGGSTGTNGIGTAKAGRRGSGVVP